MVNTLLMKVFSKLAVKISDNNWIGKKLVKQINKNDQVQNIYYKARLTLQQYI